MKSIAVFCGSSIGFDPIFKQSAIDLGNEFVARNITLVYGGAKIGLMGTLADTIIKAGGSVIGVIPKLLIKEEVIKEDVTELILTKTMGERKKIMSQLCDGYISLPGGFGTMDELFETLTMSQLFIEQKPNGILNVKGYFDFMLQQMDHMVSQGFVQKHNLDLLISSNTTQGLLQKMEEYKAPNKSSIIKKVVPGRKTSTRNSQHKK